jgi:hypothetical protein
MPSDYEGLAKKSAGYARDDKVSAQVFALLNIGAAIDAQTQAIRDLRDEVRIVGKVLDHHGSK